MGCRFKKRGNFGGGAGLKHNIDDKTLEIIVITGYKTDRKLSKTRDGEKIRENLVFFGKILKISGTHFGCQRLVNAIVTN